MEMTLQFNSTGKKKTNKQPKGLVGLRFAMWYFPKQRPYLRIYKHFDMGLVPCPGVPVFMLFNTG